MLWVLDTTVLIDYLRGRPAVGRVTVLAERGDLLATTAINVEEIARGLRPTETAAADELFAGLEILVVGTAAAWQAGKWRRDFADQGVTLFQADCLIAATATVNGAGLVTGNPKDFPFAGLEVTHWPVGH